MFKDAGFKLHAKSEQHINAMYAWSQFKRGIETNTSMLDALDEGKQKKIAENQVYIKTIADVLRLTAVQNIAQRGHRESDESENKGNFLAILDEIATYDPFIER